MLHMSQNNYSIQIVAELLKKENHIRSLASLLKTNQTTIARKVQELYRDNIVDFQREGRNKVIFLKKTLEAQELAYIAEQMKLIEVIEKYPLLRRIVEEIKKNEKINLAILFGSYAKGIARKESDIDIYLDTTNSKLKEQIENIDSRISVKIGNYNKDSLLIKEIDKNHVVIKGVEIYYDKNKFFS